MKFIVAASMLCLSAVFARADNFVQNGDFANGLDHWYGGGRSPADFANDNPLAGPDPFLSKGLIVPLKHRDWTKVAQDFKGKIASGVLTITYKLSPDLTFSNTEEDYVNMPDHIGYDGWKAFNTPPGQWVCFISDFGSAHGVYYELKPKLGTSDVQTYRAPINGLTPLEDKTITLAFPPGTGTLVVLSVLIENGSTD